MTKVEALKMAIEALEDYPYEHRTAKMDDALQACKDALAQPSVAELNDKLTTDEKVSIKRQINDAFNEGFEKGKAMSLVASIPLNLIKLESQSDTHPAPSWQGLNDDEMMKLANKYIDLLPNGEIFHFDLFAYAIEQALKEKNT